MRFAIPIFPIFFFFINLCPGLRIWIQIHMDTHFLSLQDLDPGAKSLRKKTQKCDEIGINCNYVQKIN